MHSHIRLLISFAIACVGGLATALLALPAAAGTNSWTAIGPPGTNNSCCPPLRGRSLVAVHDLFRGWDYHHENYRWRRPLGRLGSPRARPSQFPGDRSPLLSHDLRRPRGPV